MLKIRPVLAGNFVDLFLPAFRLGNLPGSVDNPYRPQADYCRIQGFDYPERHAFSSFYFKIFADLSSLLLEHLPVNDKMSAYSCQLLNRLYSFTAL